MKCLTGLMALGALLGSAQLAQAAIITEEYKGSQDVNEGQTFTFNFDLWSTNSGSVNDNAPGLSLTKDGVGALGAWTAGTLYVDFLSSDFLDPEKVTLDLNAWTFRIGGAADVLADTFQFSRPTIFGDDSYSASYTLSSSQLNLLDNYGGGTLRVTAPSVGGYVNDFTITRVGLSATAAGTPPVKVAEPSTLSLLGLGLLAVGAMAMGRRSSRRETLSFV